MILRRLFSKRKSKTPDERSIVGRVVRSVSGRDKGDIYVVVDQPELIYVTVADGKRRSVSKPKRKNVRHLFVTDRMLPDEYIVRGKVVITDGEAADFIEKIASELDS